MAPSRLSALSTALNRFSVRNIAKVRELKESPSSQTKIPEVRVVVATTEKEKIDAYRLGYLEYLKKGYIQENNHGLLVTPADLSYNTVVLNAYIGDKIGGTITIVTDYLSKLPASEVFAENIPTGLIGEKVSELTRLAIHEGFKLNKELLMALFNHAFICGKYLKKSAGFIIEVNPRHKKFYEKMIGFKSLNICKDCGRVNGAPAELLYVNFEWEEEYRQKYKYFVPESTQNVLIEIQKAKLRETQDLFDLKCVIEEICYGDTLEVVL